MNTLFEEVIIKKMAIEGLKLVSYGQKEMKLTDLEKLKETLGIKSEEFREALEGEIGYICTFGMNDPPKATASDGNKKSS